MSTHGSNNNNKSKHVRDSVHIPSNKVSLLKKQERKNKLSDFKIKSGPGQADQLVKASSQ